MNVTRFFWFLLLSSVIEQSFGQATFILESDELCLEESLSLSNTSTGMTEFEWDFCLGDFEGEPNSQSVSVSGLGSGFGMEIIYYEGNYHGFVTDRTNDKLWRLDYGSDPMNDPTINDLGNPGSLLDNPEGISIINFDNNWYGVVGYLDNGGSLTRLDFGTSPLNTPSGSDLGKFGFSSRIRFVKFLQINSQLYLSFNHYNTNEFVIVDYRDSFDNAIDLDTDIYSTGSILELSFSTGFDYEYLDNGDHIFYIVSLLDESVILLNYGNDILSIPSQTDYELTGLSNNYGFEILREGTNYYGIISNTSQAIKVYDLGNLETPVQPTELSFTSTLPSTKAIRLYRFNGNSYLKGYNGGTEVNLEFIANCSASTSFSTIFEPAGITYNDTPGEKILWLKAFDSDGNASHSVDTITILPQTAPSISHTSQEVCVSNPITFTPSNPGLSSYSWDFDGDGSYEITDDNTGSDQSFDYSGLGIGTYTVRLDVSDGTCDNFYEEEITIYDPPPAPTYMYSSTQTCVNANFTFTNTTIDGAYSGPLEYLWEFIDEASGTVVATASTKDAIYAFETPGEKTVRLTSSIPGCEEITEQTFMITAGPTADFAATSVCQNEPMQFTNLSIDAVSFEWDFGDEFTSSATNPSHVYSEAGNYFVTLTAFDAEGCEDTEVIEVAASDSPQISFDFEVPCTSEGGVPFTDLSTVTNSDVVGWTWFVDGEEVSTQQNPVLNFTEAGIKNISLAVTSSNGCESTYNEDIEIFSSPVPDFTVTVGCEGEATSFEDVTPGTVSSWLWTVNGTNYSTEDASHIFTDAGTYEVTLEVTGQNFCTESITKSIEIIELPTLDFSLSGDCDNDLISVTDLSTSVADPIISRNWLLDGTVVGNGSQLFLELSDDSYELQLEVETEGGCMLNSTRMIQINDSPIAEFTSSRTYGIPGDSLNFSNGSSGAVSYQWLLNGSVISTSDQSQNINFSEPGTHTVSLVAQNSLGCNDTTDQEILIAIPEVDLSIGSFELVNENNTGKVFLEIQNFSNLPVELTEAQITLEGQFSITEQILEFIDIGESSLVSLNLGIPITSNVGTSYLCVKLSSQYEGYDDIDPLNNEKCLTIQPQVKVENPFPNPVTDRFRIKVIAPTDGQANLILINSAGKIQMDRVYNAKAGLNNFFVDMSALDPGIYFITIDVLGTLHKRKVIKL